MCPSHPRGSIDAIKFASERIVKKAPYDEVGCFFACFNLTMIGREYIIGYRGRGYNQPGKQ